MIKKYSLILSCFVCFYLHSQSNRISFILKSKLIDSIKQNQIELLFKKQVENKNDSICFFYNQYAYWLYDVSLTKAIKYEKKCYELIKKSSASVFFKQKSMIALGFYYEKNKEFNKSLKLFKEVIDLDNVTKYGKRAYERVAHIYSLKKDYLSAIAYYKVTLKFDYKSKSNKVRLYLNLSNIYSNAFKDKINIKKGLKYAKYADSISESIKISDELKFKIKFRIASFYNTESNLNIKEALLYYDEAIKIAKINKNIKNINLINIYKGNLYNMDDFEKSLYYLDMVNVNYEKISEFELWLLYNNYGLTYLRNNKFKKGISYLHKGFENLLGDDLKDYKNINLNIINKSDKKYQLIEFFPILAESYLKLYEQTNNYTWLDKSINYFKLSDYLFDIIKINNIQFNSKIFWQKISSDIYSNAIKACFLKGNTKDALYFMEKNKALLLMIDIASQNYRYTAHIPFKKIEKENTLKRKLILLENNILKKDSLSKVIIDIKRELQTLQDSIYKKEKIEQPKILNIKQIQSNLKENEVFVEYHVSVDDGYGIYTNQENGYLIVLTKNNKYFLEIDYLSKLKKEVASLINQLKKPSKTNEDFKVYNKLSHKVYNKLFPTKEIRDLIKNKKVKIAPDSYLSLLPFETLITKINPENNKNNKPNYLIRECNISYLYSYSFLKQNNIKENKNKQFLGFAPISFNYDNLSDINNSKKEVLNLDKHYKGDTFLKETATKKNFLEKLHNYNIVHIATHANAQDSINPWIAFYDEKLSLNELYLAKNNASLVVLSGCNTTLGKQEIGEGIMSLARGFFYGGSQSVISSLWNVDDTATPYIMDEFYKNLSHGKTKSEALHLAKLNYLENHTLSEASPHFWASFILLGQDNIVETSKINYWFWIIGLLCLCILFLLFRRFKPSHQQQP